MEVPKIRELERISFNKEYSTVVYQQQQQQHLLMQNRKHNASIGMQKSVDLMFE